MSERFYAGASKEARDSERARFNALSQEDAKKIIANMEGKESAMRSCWYCNGAHDRLKDADYPIICLMGCGLWYLTGYPAVIVARRAAGTEITEETMQEFEKALKDDEA